MHYLHRERILRHGTLTDIMWAMKLFELDWLNLNFQNQANGLMSPGVYVISAGSAVDETSCDPECAVLSDVCK